jgi:hypothetical protein
MLEAIQADGSSIVKVNVAPATTRTSMFPHAGSALTPS